MAKRGQPSDDVPCRRRDSSVRGTVAVHPNGAAAVQARQSSPAAVPVTRVIRRVGRRAIEAAAALIGSVLPVEARVVFRNRLRDVSRLDYPAATILLHVDSEIECRTRLHSCSREPDTVAWLEGALRGGDVFYDVGANVGAYSLLAAKAGAPPLRVVAFEPSAVTFAQLVRNIALNGCQDVITPLHVALTDRTSLEIFNCSSLESGRALHALGGATDHLGRAFQPSVRIPVLAFRLDDLIEQFALPRPTLVKIDVDGGELGVLKGATMTLADPDLRAVLLETDEQGADHQGIVTLLERCGFVVAAKRQIVPDGSGRLAALHNYVFQRGAGRVPAPAFAAPTHP